MSTKVGQPDFYTDEEPQNYDQKCPVVFVIDRSGSMIGAPINECNKGLKLFETEVPKDATCKARLDIAVISFGSDTIGYLLNKEKSEWNINLLYIRKQMLDNTYRVEMKNNISYLDFQHAFTPYAYYNSSFSSLQLSSTYVYHLKKYGVGINVKAMYRQGDRSPDVFYTKQIGFHSSAPSISPLPDKQDEIWSSVTLFVVF